MERTVSQANRAYELLEHHPDHHAFRNLLLTKRQIHYELGQQYNKRYLCQASAVEATAINGEIQTLFTSK